MLNPSCDNEWCVLWRRKKIPYTMYKYTYTHCTHTLNRYARIQYVQPIERNCKESMNLIYCANVLDKEKESERVQEKLTKRNKHEPLCTYIRIKKNTFKENSFYAF